MKSTFKEFFEQFGVNPDDMKVGKPINVSEANIGVLGYNETSCKDEYTKVEFLVKNKKQAKVKLIFDKADYSLECAKKHKLAIYKNPMTGKLNYSLVKDLKPGMKVYTLDGYKEISEIKKISSDYCYDIQTDLHNFYSDGILSHNSLMSHAIVTTGGRALKFFASTRNRVTKIDTIEKDGETIGITMKVRNYKNKTGVMFREAEMKLLFDTGFDSKSEYLDFFIKLGIIVQGGAWFKSEKYDIKLNGKAEVQKWLDEHPKEFEEMRNTVDEMLSKQTAELDGNNQKPDEADADEAEEKKAVEDLASQALADDTEPKEESPDLDV